MILGLSCLDLVIFGKFSKGGLASAEGLTHRSSPRLSGPES